MLEGDARRRHARLLLIDASRPVGVAISGDVAQGLRAAVAGKVNGRRQVPVELVGLAGRDDQAEGIGALTMKIEYGFFEFRGLALT